MGFLTSTFETRAAPTRSWLETIRSGGVSTAAGVSVSIRNSVQSTAVFACARILAETVASLPLHLYRRLERGKERATDHPLYSILHRLPNSELTSMELREALMGHLALWGNAYAEIERDNGGRVLGIWPLRPDRMQVERIEGRLIYVYDLPGGPREGLPAERVMHLRGLGYDGVRGYSPIALGRQAVGLALATEEFGARFFGNDARPGVILEHPGQLSDKAAQNLRASWETEHQGLSKKHRIAILEEGMSLKEIGIPPEDAQFLETRKFQVTEIARMFRVPPHMLADLERATFSNIEHQSLEFVMHTLNPWLVRWEQAIYRNLLTAVERRTLFAEHLVDGLLRGDTESRYNAYATARQNGWLSANDIREMENLNPVEGGDEYLVPLNMVPASGLAPARAEGNGRATRALSLIEERAKKRRARDRQRLAASYRRVLLDTTTRIVRREVNDVRRAVRRFFGKRNAQEFRLWLTEFYENHRAFFIRQMLPILLAYAEQIDLAVAGELDSDPRGVEEIEAFIDQYVEALAARQVGESFNQIRGLLDEALRSGEDPRATLEARLDDWEERRPEKIAGHEAFNAANAFAKAFYILAGITRLRWVARGENCPYCRDLDGQTVGIQKFFLEKDTDFEPEGADRPLNKRHNVSHPPLHNGCDCVILAER